MVCFGSVLPLAWAASVSAFPLLDTQNAESGSHLRQGQILQYQTAGHPTTSGRRAGRFDAFSLIMSAGELILPLVMDGMI
jgi:hypothetical protein